MDAASTGGPLTAHERYAFDVSGFVVRRQALHPVEVDELNRAVDALNLPRPGSTIQSQRFNRHLAAASAFRRLIDHHAVLQPVLELCGQNARLDHAYGIVMAPGTSGLSLHGGGTPHDPAQHYHVHNGRMYNGLVAAQWALVDHNTAAGGFICIPGSHRANFALPSPLDHDLVRDVPLNAGDLIIFTEALTHGTRPWNATYDRRSLLFKYSPGHASWGLDYTHELGDLAHSDLVTPRQARLLQPPAVSPHAPVLGAPD